MMIKYGDTDTYDFIREGYVKNGSSFWNDWSMGVESVGGYYLKRCTSYYCYSRSDEWSRVCMYKIRMHQFV